MSCVRPNFLKNPLYFVRIQNIPVVGAEKVKNVSVDESKDVQNISIVGAEKVKDVPVDKPKNGNKISVVGANKDVSLNESKDDQNISMVGAEVMPLVSNKTFTIFDTFPEIENIVARISDCFSSSPKEKGINPPAPTKYLNSRNLKSVNNVIYLTSFIKKHYSKNVINKMSKSKNDTLERGSKNMVNDISKSENFMQIDVLLRYSMRKPPLPVSA